MRVSAHLAASAAAAAAVFPGGGPEVSLPLLLTGTLLDLDHIPQVSGAGLEIGRPRVLLDSLMLPMDRLEDKHGFERGVPDGPLFPLLHSIELLVLLTIAAVTFSNPVLAGCSAGLGLHLLMDLRAYPCSPLFFSLAWRITRWEDRLRPAWRRFRARDHLDPSQSTST